VELYGLEMLKTGGDLSVENGNIAVTKDGDLKLGDTAHNALFRFTQAWRLNSQHLHFLFGLIGSMRDRRTSLDGELNQIVFSKGAAEPGATFHRIRDEQRAAEYGSDTYAGCVILLLSGLLLRFRDDAEATVSDWTNAGPQFGGCSVGQLIVASANGFRHDDEWSKTRVPTPQQQTSQNILSKALGSMPVLRYEAPGRCPEVLDMLSKNGDFDALGEKIFSFAHEIAVRGRPNSNKK